VVHYFPTNSTNNEKSKNPALSSSESAQLMILFLGKRPTMKICYREKKVLMDRKSLIKIIILVDESGHMMQMLSA